MDLPQPRSCRLAGAYGRWPGGDQDARARVIVQAQDIAGQGCNPLAPFQVDFIHAVEKQQAPAAQFALQPVCREQSLRALAGVLAAFVVVAVAQVIQQGRGGMRALIVPAIAVERP